MSLTREAVVEAHLGEYKEYSIDVFHMVYFYHFVELMQLTGVSAILRFPMPDLEDDEEGEPSDSDWPTVDTEYVAYIICLSLNMLFFTIYNHNWIN